MSRVLLILFLATSTAFAQQTVTLNGVSSQGMTLSADPTSNLQPATKQYVDNNKFNGGTVATAITAPGFISNGTGGSGFTVTPNGTDPAPPANSIVYAAPQSVATPYDFWAPTNVTAAQSSALPLQCQYVPYAAGPPVVQPHLACSLGGGTLPAQIQAGQVSGNYYGLSYNGTLSATGMAGVFADSTNVDKNIYLDAPTGGNFQFKIANVTAFQVQAGNHPTGSCSVVGELFTIGDGYWSYCNGTSYVNTAPGASGGLGNGFSTGVVSGNYSCLTATGSCVNGSSIGFVADTTGADPTIYMQAKTGGQVHAKAGTVDLGAFIPGGLLIDSSTAPTCSSTYGGTINYTAGATGVKDTVQVCAKDATNTYAWRTIY